MIRRVERSITILLIGVFLIVILFYWHYDTAVMPSARSRSRKVLRVTDPRFDGYAIGIKSGQDVFAEHVPHLLVTSLRAVKNIHIIGDASFPIGEWNMENVLDNPLIKRDIRHKPDIKSTDRLGWKMDAHKFLPAMKSLKSKFPHAEWYILIDDDTYILMDNLHRHLSQWKSTREYYFGSAHSFVGCDNIKTLNESTPFGHGGAGIVVSSAAIDKLLHNGAIDKCIQRYHDCFAGDIRLALCFRDVGIQLHNQPFGVDTFNVGTPHWNSYEYDDQPCARPISFHHLNGFTILSLYKAEKLAFQRSKALFDKASKRYNPHLFSYNHEHDYVISDFYAPVHNEDLWSIFTQNDTKASNISVNSKRDFFSIKQVPNIKSANDCVNACQSQIKCQSWNYASDKCQLMNGIGRLEESPNSSTGLILDRYKCKARQL